MGKKKRAQHFTKPPSRNYAATPSSSSKETSVDTVNDLLARSRINASNSNNNRKDVLAAQRKAVALATAPTVHPSLKEFLDIPDTPAPKTRYDERLRLQRLCRPLRMAHEWPIFSAGARLPSFYPFEIQSVRGPTGFVPLPKIGRHTLVHQAMKILGQNWDEIISAHPNFVCKLPVKIKANIPAYVAWARLNMARLDIWDYKCLFPPRSYSSGLVQHIELAGSFGHTITRSQLRELLLDEHVDQSQGPGITEVALDWQESLILLENRPFDNLTHLSLANPGPAADWIDLFSLKDTLCQITHLSLAYWPYPSMVRRTSRKFDRGSLAQRQMNSVLVGWGNNQPDDIERTKGHTVLHRLMCATPRLQYLDLTGCFQWIGLLITMEGEQRTLGKKWLELRTLKLDFGHDIAMDWRAMWGERSQIPDWLVEDEATEAQRQSWALIFARAMLLYFHGKLINLMKLAMLEIKGYLAVRPADRFRPALYGEPTVELTWEYADNNELCQEALKWAEEIGVRDPANSRSMAATEAILWPNKLNFWGIDSMCQHPASLYEQMWEFIRWQFTVDQDILEERFDRLYRSYWTPIEDEMRRHFQRVREMDPEAVVDYTGHEEERLMRTELFIAIKWAPMYYSLM